MTQETQAEQEDAISPDAKTLLEALTYEVGAKHRKARAKLVSDHAIEVNRLQERAKSLEEQLARLRRIGASSDGKIATLEAEVHHLQPWKEDADKMRDLVEGAIAETGAERQTYLQQAAMLGQAMEQVKGIALISLSRIIEARVKEADAPASSTTLLNSAIDSLHSLFPNWRAGNEEGEEVLQNAKEEMRLLRAHQATE